MYVSLEHMWDVYTTRVNASHTNTNKSQTVRLISRKEILNCTLVLISLAFSSFLLLQLFINKLRPVGSLSTVRLGDFHTGNLQNEQMQNMEKKRESQHYTVKHYKMQPNSLLYTIAVCTGTQFCSIRPLERIGALEALQ